MTTDPFIDMLPKHLAWELVPGTHPQLSREIKPFDFKNPLIDPELITIEMIRVMHEQRGVGLAANQLGLPVRMFVMDGEPALACFNPKIIDFGKEEVYMEEGCLTYPGLKVKIKRPSAIRVRFTLPTGETYTDKFAGLTARIFQHEEDHLNGIRFFDRATRFHREAAFKRWNNIQRAGAR